MRIGLAQINTTVGDFAGNQSRILDAYAQLVADGAELVITPELAVEIDAAAVLAIDPDDPAERAYLAMLASRLKLEPGLRAAIERETAKVLA